MAVGLRRRGGTRATTVRLPRAVRTGRRVAILPDTRVMEAEPRGPWRSTDQQEARPRNASYASAS
jgi:hypothetical protein